MSIFNSQTKIKIPQSVHNLSHTQSGTFYPGYIYPIFSEKVVPGDLWQMQSVPFLRSQPAVSPLLTNVRVSFRYFYCRNQLLWENFDEFITNKPRNGSATSVSHVHPNITVNMSLSTNQSPEKVGFFDWIYCANNLTKSYSGLDALPARMYNRVYSEYYANEAMMSSISLITGDGTDTSTAYQLRKACYKKDYFTAALPWTQRGAAAALPTDVVAKPVASLGLNPYTKVIPTGVNPTVTDDGTVMTEVSGSNKYLRDQAGSPLVLDPNGTLTTQIDIRDFRRATAVQRFLERSAVNGNRYAEYLLSNYGVVIPDRSAYKPQYLGGGEQLINFSPVEQTGATVSGQTPLGTLAGKGTMSGIVGMNKKYLFTEPGWIMCLMVIRPDATYVGGVPRHKYTLNDRLEDYYNPLFQNIGMQQIYNREISYTGLSTDNDPFAYVERYADYKTCYDQVHGDFLKGMKSWVAARDFSSNPPTFNEAFTLVNADSLDNNMAVTTANYPPFFGSIRHIILARRPMQYHAKYQ